MNPPPHAVLRAVERIRRKSDLPARLLATHFRPLDADAGGPQGAERLQDREIAGVRLIGWRQASQNQATAVAGAVASRERAECVPGTDFEENAVRMFE